MHPPPFFHLSGLFSLGGNYQYIVVYSQRSYRGVILLWQGYRICIPEVTFEFHQFCF